MQMATEMMPRRVWILAFNMIVFIFFFWSPLSVVLRSMGNELYSHIVLIPFITGYLIYLNRNKIFSSREYSISGGSILITASIITYITGKTLASILDKNDFFSIMVVSSVLFLIGTFLLVYGSRAFWEAQFPLCFLFFMVPVPTVIIDQVIFLLQSGSTEVSYLFLNVLGVPVFREGFVFHLPTITVEVAKECSGIRSSLALVIVTVLAAHLFLRDSWRRVVLLICVIPVVIIKNGVRITVLSVLATYVDTRFITNSTLHRDGGVLFFMLGVIILGSVLWLLGKYEKKPKVE
jgi:exosortase